MAGTYLPKQMIATIADYDKVRVDTITSVKLRVRDDRSRG